jgi:hypothetical protein
MHFSLYWFTLKSLCSACERRTDFSIFPIVKYVIFPAFFVEFANMIGLADGGQKGIWFGYRWWFLPIDGITLTAGQDATSWLQCIAAGVVTRIRNGGSG